MEIEIQLRISDGRSINVFGRTEISEAVDAFANICVSYLFILFFSFELFFGPPVGG